MTTFAVLAPCNRIKPIRGRGLAQAHALNLARAEAEDFHGVFVVVQEDTLAEVAAFKERTRFGSYRTAVGTKRCNPVPTYAALLHA